MDITWRDFSREGEGRNREGKVQGRSSIISRHKIDRERSKWYGKQRTQRTYMYNPWMWTKQGVNAGGLGEEG